MNPFIYNVPVRRNDFINRENIINRLLQETILSKSQGNVWLAGERQVGKTSLLRFIQNSYEDSKIKVKVYGQKVDCTAVFIYTNVQNCDSRQMFYQNMWQSLKNTFDFKLLYKGDSVDNFITNMEYIFKQGFYIVFLLDEFDAFIQNLINIDPHKAITVLGELNKLAASMETLKGSPKVFGCILAANSTYYDLLKQIDVPKDSGSGLISIGMELEWFTKDQVRLLAEKYSKEDPVKFTDNDINFCYKLTKGYPFFVQRLFSIMYDKILEDPVAKKYQKNIKKEYANIIKQTIQNWGGKKMPERTIIKLLELIEYIGDKAITFGLDLLLKKLAG